MISKLSLILQLCVILLSSQHLFSMNPQYDEEVIVNPEPFTLEEENPVSDDEFEGTQPDA